MKAIVLTADRYRAVTDHMILKYEEVWPDHPFVFRVPYQELGGNNTARVEYFRATGSTPAEIPAMILDLLSDVADDDWVYWCLDDKYPIQLVLPKIAGLLEFAKRGENVDGLLFCRTRVLLDQPEQALLPNNLTTPQGDILLERRGWQQIWIHQLLRAKVLRYFFSTLQREQITTAKSMDPLKDKMPKPDHLRLYVTKENFAVFGESTHRGKITRNCLESLRQTNIAIPEWFQHDNGETITVGELPRKGTSFLGKLANKLGW